EEGVNERGETAFTIGTDDPKRALIQPIVRECQVWRGGDLLHRGPIMVGRESDDGATTTYVVPDFRWYYEGRGSADGANRLMARVPRLQLLKNGGFTQGFTYWRALYDAESIPALPPLYTIVDDPETLSGKAIDVTGADESQLHTEDVATSAVFVPNESTYLSGGEAIIEAVGENIPDGATVRITGHTANDGTGSGLGLSHDRALAAKATLAAQNGTLQFVTPDTSKWKAGQYVTGGNVAGRGYYEPVSKQLAPNRRVTIAYDGTLPATGHKQFIVQTYYIAHPTTAKYPLTLTANARYKLLEYIGASADGWNLRVRAVRTSTLEEYDSNSASISEDTPLNRWFDLEASVEIPADGNSYRIDVRLYPPAGTARFADVGLYPEELLYFWGVDQAHIVRDVLAFAQDPDYGWSDLGITTRTPVTGVTRDRSYELTGGSPLPVKQVLDEFPSLAHGVDIGVTMRHDLSRVDTHYPRQGGPTNVVLVEGGAVVRARPASDRDAFSLVLVRASEGGRYRPEALAKDDAALDGLRLAKYLTAESETPITELDEAARDELARSKVTTPAYIVECDPAYTSELRSRLDLGDTCRLILPRYGFDGLVRTMQRAQDPNTDGLTLLLTVED
ncbi:MAG TPA: hypothetical protein VIR15_07915, partial [Intrasporangium sp.]|uniref:hypothetical protein n=1 Tax=Intrasporangium sp. TaxID=1925024 RepID=UPI002F95D3EB